MADLVLDDTQRALVESHINLVWWCIHRIHGRRRAEVDDLFQEGCLALVRCALRYRPVPGVRFAGYAKQAVYGAMLRYLYDSNDIQGRQKTRTVYLSLNDTLHEHDLRTVHGRGEALIIDQLIVETWLAELRPEDRRLVEGIALDDRSATDLARELDLPMRVVTQRYGRALDKLIPILRRDGVEMPRRRRRGRKEILDRDLVTHHEPSRYARSA